MFKRNFRWLAFVGTSILFAVDLSPCGPTGDLMEILLPIAIGFAT